MPESALDWADQLSRLLDRAPSAEALAAQDDAALIDLIAATERAKGRLAAAQARAEAAFWDAQIGEQQRQGVPRGLLSFGIVRELNNFLILAIALSATHLPRNVSMVISCYLCCIEDNW